MADRVAIIGGSTVGRDHFPFPVSDATLPGYGPGTFPFAIDLPTACKWLYLVRRWSVAIEIVATNHTGAVLTDISYSCSFDFGLGMSFIDPVSFEFIRSVSAPDVRESDLVANDRSGVSNLVFGSGNDQAGFDGDPDFWFPYEVKNFTSVNAGRSKTISFVLNPWGMFWVSDGIRPVSVFQINSRDFSATTSDNTTGSPSTLGTFTIDGLSVDIFGRNFGVGGNFDVLNSVDCTMTPLTYWPYATKAGLPVYDTSTGAQLADPFS